MGDTLALLPLLALNAVRPRTGAQHRAALDAEFIRELCHLVDVEIADGDNAELVGIVEVALGDVRATDASANNGDYLDVAHCSHGVPRSASRCAVSAISIAL